MRDYGKVHTSFWTSTNIRTMSEDGRALAMYLLTSPHGTIAGAFRLPDGYVCEDMQWTSERVSEGFAELARNGFATRCATSKWVWVIKHFHWNPPENPNQRKAAAKVAASIPAECAWKREFLRVHGPMLGFGDEYEIDPCETLSQPLPNQEQEQEQQQEQEQEQDVSPPAAKPAARAADTTRGSRLPGDWALPKAWGEWALTEYPHWSANTVRDIAAQFADHWRAKPGKDGRKTDWQATWRNWCRSDITQRAHPPSRPANAPMDTASRNAEARRLLGFAPQPETIDA